MRFEVLVDVLRGILRGFFSIETKEVKAQKASGVIYVPKKFIGKKVILILENEN